MSYILHDPDEWETVTDCRTYGSHPADARVQMGWCSQSLKRRAPEDVARIKAERLRLEEDTILARAEEIKAKRAQPSQPGE